MALRLTGILVGSASALWMIVWGVTAGYQRGYPAHTWEANNLYPWLSVPFLFLMPLFSVDRVYRTLSVLIAFVAGGFGLGSYWCWWGTLAAARPGYVPLWKSMTAWLVWGIVTCGVMACLFRLRMRPAYPVVERTDND